MKKWLWAIILFVAVLVFLIVYYHNLKPKGSVCPSGYGAGLNVPEVLNVSLDNSEQAYDVLSKRDMRNLTVKDIVFVDVVGVNINCIPNGTANCEYKGKAYAFRCGNEAIGSDGTIYRAMYGL